MLKVLRQTLTNKNSNIPITMATFTIVIIIIAKSYNIPVTNILQYPNQNHLTFWLQIPSQYSRNTGILGHYYYHFQIYVKLP